LNHQTADTNHLNHHLSAAFQEALAKHRSLRLIPEEHYSQSKGILEVFESLPTSLRTAALNQLCYHSMALAHHIRVTYTVWEREPKWGIDAELANASAT
jgi:hypothetical protein